MRSSVATVVMLAGLLVAGCGSSDPTGLESAASEPATIPLPDGFAPLDPSNVAEELVTAMYGAEAVNFRTSALVVVDDGDLEYATDGTLRFGASGTDVDMSWRMGSEGEHPPEHGGSLVVLDDVGYLSGQWMFDIVWDPMHMLSWVRVAADDPQAPPALLAMVRETTNELTPEAHLSVLVGTTALRPAEIEESLLGQVAVWYEGEADTAEAAITTDDADLAELLRQFSDLGVETVPYRLLVDRDARPLELTFEVAAGEMVLTFTASYSQWGQGRTIAVPDDVVTWAEAIGPPGD